MEYSYSNICAYCFGQKGYSHVCPHCGYEEKISATANHLPPRTLLQSRYLIGAVIGIGGFGIVYKAFDLKLNRIIAVKELFPPSLVNRIAGQQEVIITSGSNVPQFMYMLDRFRTEAKSLSRLVNNPNITGIYDCIDANNTAYIIMECLDGETLDNRLNRQGKLNPLEALRITTAMLDGLSAAHAYGIIHRDIKPSNIFICRDGSVRIIDFGAAGFVGFEEDPRMICSKVFTDGFAPPEQYREDAEQGPYTDIYAAGATMYCMLTAHIPPPSPDLLKNVKLAPPSKWAPGVPESMERAILRAMSLDPRIRFATAEQFKTALMSNRGVRTEPEELAARKRRRTAAVAAVLLVLCAVAFGGWYYLQQLRSSGSSQVMLTADEDISVYVCVSEEDREELQAVYDTIEMGFAEYASGMTDHTITANVECVTEKELSAAADGEEAPVLMCGKSFGTPSESDWLTSLLDSSYMFPSGAEGGFVTAFDMDVLYVNKKLLAAAGADDISLDSMESVAALGQVNAAPDLFGKYDSFAVSDSALDDFCAGRSIFCAARASDIRTVSQALPGYCSAVAIPGGSIEAGYVDVWYINGETTENRQHTAELFLAYLAGDEAQDVLCLQNSCGIPANASIYQLYRSYHPELADVLDDSDSFAFD